MLTSKQRGILRSLGNELDPILTVGKGGVNEQVIIQLEQALTARELVKARVLPHTDHNPRETANVLSEATSSDVVQVIGRNILFYRAPIKGESKIMWVPEE